MADSHLEAKEGGLHAKDRIYAYEPWFLNSRTNLIFCKKRS